MTFFACFIKLLVMKIGNIELKNNIFLAPMAGVSDVGFRALASFFGAEIAYTEMVSAKGLIYGEGKALKSPLNPNFAKNEPEIASNKSAWLLLTEDVEKVKAVQLFGADPKFMARACKLKLLEKFNIIDINMGCPAPKIIRNGEGSALMDNINLAREVIENCRKATEKPLTVKFRKGFKTDNAIEFAKMCEQAGADAITVHARLASQGYSGKVDYALLCEIKKSVSIPVIGSGDVENEETLRKMLETGVDGVMVGRASFGNPAIFKTLNEIKDGKEKEPLDAFVQRGDFFKDVLTSEDIEKLSENEKYVKYICAKKHIQILRKYFSEPFLVKYMRKHMLWYSNGVKGQAESKRKIALSNDLDFSLKLLKKMIENENCSN